MIFQTFTLAAALIGGAQAASVVSRDFLFDPSLILPGRSTCNILLPLDPFYPTSCQNKTVEQNLCCFEAPGGHLLQTQFWDYEDPLEWAGPNDTWTIHGLWPDHCDGTYDQFCDSSRQVSNITQILQAHGENEILDYMHTYWKDNTGNDESFWEHEFNKHATCYSTLRPQCIQHFQPGDDVVIFIKRVISLYQLLPTHVFLAAKGIVPSTTQKYNLTDIRNTIIEFTGKKPTIGCDGTGNQYLHEMWYHYQVKGSIIDGLYFHADADSNDTCADQVYYWPKGVAVPKPPKPTATSTSSAPTATSTTDQGTIQVFTSAGANIGCILSKGTWSQQTCATFHPALGSAVGTITLKSSKGPCGVLTNGTLSCSSDITVGSDFTNSSIAGGSLIAYNGSSTFYADILPTGTVQSTVFVDTNHTQAITLVYTRT